MSHPKPPQELVDKWIAVHTYEILSQTYLQANGEKKTDWHSVMGKWCADAQLKSCLDWFEDFYKGESWMLKDLKRFRDSQRKPNDELKVIVNGIPFPLTVEQTELLNQIIKSNA